jgi:site-specific DNA-methyltransferase (adenine-specific)
MLKEIELNKIYNEDCLETMKRMPDKSVDLVVTSPPYNVGKNNMTENKYGGGDAMSQEDYGAWTRKIIDELLRISKNVFYNIQMLSDNKRTVLSILGEYQNKIKDIIVWNKKQVAPAIEAGVMNSKFEFIIIFSNDFPEKRKFADANFHGNFANVIEGNNAAQENNYSEVHKATFPLYLPSKIIHNFTKEGDTIYDPFMGLGTTAMAARNLKRNYIGSEISPEYCKIAEQRLRQETLL